MTGRYAPNVGLSLALLRGNPAGLGTEYPTLPEHLSALGYTNYLVGKWHLGQSKKMFHPLQRGFHEFYGMLGGGFNHYTKQIGGGRFDLWRGYDPVFDNTTHSTDLFNDEAVRVIEDHLEKVDDDPFFLYLAYAAPHDPLAAPERHQSLCSHIRNERRRLSCAMVAGVDEGVGRIVELLEKKEILENTILVFSSDNGGVPYAGAFNYPFRGGKGTLYEGGVRSPGFIHSPNMFRNGFDYKELFHVSDFFPTLSAMIQDSTITKIEIPKADELDGLDHLSAFKDGTSGPRSSVHIHRDWDRDGHAYRRGPWKIIVGHHCLPLFFTKVYNETNTRWLVEGGGVRDKILQLILEAMDKLVGTENSTFVEYLLWMIFDSFNVGGIHRARSSTGSTTNVRLSLNLKVFKTLTNFQKIGQDVYKSDLEYYLKEQDADPIYPLVSLFNVDDDPGEASNLANKYPELVKKLLEEAEKVIENAPKQWRGDMIYAEAPVSKQQNWFSTIRSLGTHFDVVIPFGIYLEDHVDLTKLTYVRMLHQQLPEGVFILAKVFTVVTVFPLLLLVIALNLSRC